MKPYLREKQASHLRRFPRILPLKQAILLAKMPVGEVSDR